MWVVLGPSRVGGQSPVWIRAVVADRADCRETRESPVRVGALRKRGADLRAQLRTSHQHGRVRVTTPNVDAIYACAHQADRRFSSPASGYASRRSGRRIGCSRQTSHCWYTPDLSIDYSSYTPDLFPLREQPVAELLQVYQRNVLATCHGAITKTALSRSFLPEKPRFGVFGRASGVVTRINKLFPTREQCARHDPAGAAGFLTRYTAVWRAERGPIVRFTRRDVFPKSPVRRESLRYARRRTVAVHGATGSRHRTGRGD